MSNGGQSTWRAQSHELSYKFHGIPKQFENVTRSIQQSIRYPGTHGAGWSRKFTIDTWKQLDRSRDTMAVNVSVCVEYWPRETVSPESSGTRSANRSEPSFRSWPIRDSRDTIFQWSHGDASKRGWQETRVTGLRVPEFRLSPSERIISFHSHELSEFPVDSRLLERQIPGSASIAVPTSVDKLGQRTLIFVFSYRATGRVD